MEIEITEGDGIMDDIFKPLAKDLLAKAAPEIGKAVFDLGSSVLKDRVVPAIKRKIKGRGTKLQKWQEEVDEMAKRVTNKALQRFDPTVDAFVEGFENSAVDKKDLIAQFNKHLKGKRSANKKQLSIEANRKRFSKLKL